MPEKLLPSEVERRLKLVVTVEGQPGTPIVLENISPETTIAELIRQLIPYGQNSGTKVKIVANQASGVVGGADFGWRSGAAKWPEGS